jgi:hypothetical protein
MSDIKRGADSSLWNVRRGNESDLAEGKRTEIDKLKRVTSVGGVRGWLH